MPAFAPIAFVLLLAGCASADQGGQSKAIPGPTAQDREISQLMGTTRKGERQWRALSAQQRGLREQVLGVSSAAGLALARKELLAIANRNILQVLRHSDGEPSDGTYIRSHPVTFDVAGNPRAIVSFLVGIESQAPKFRLGDLSLSRRRSAGVSGYSATLSVDVLERIAVPPPLVPPPVAPAIPLKHADAVKALRAHIRHLDKAVNLGRDRVAQLRVAKAEVGGGSPVLSGPVAALFPKGSPADVDSASFGGGQLAATAHAATEEDARTWADAVDRHAAIAPGVVVSTSLKALDDGKWGQVVDLAGATVGSKPPAIRTDAPRTSR